MKIAYLKESDFSSQPGVANKIQSQIKQWISSGHNVLQIDFSNGVVTHSHGETTTYSINSNRTSSKNATKTEKLLRLPNRYKFCAGILSDFKPDITYTRYLFPMLGINSIKRHAGQLVFEINSNDIPEYKTTSRSTGIYNKIFRGYSLSAADAFIFVTRELSESPDFKSYSRKRTVIANGIEPQNYLFNEATKNNVPHLAFIGSPKQIWHGLDKIKHLATVLSGCIIHVIGPNQEECAMTWGNKPDNIVIHGWLPQDAAQRILANVDVGISTLALHRKNMNEACPLKVRQYLAHGLPIIGAGIDTDIADDEQFYLRLPNEENNIIDNPEEIIDFVKKIFLNTELRRRIRKFATTKLSAEKKEIKRLNFFKSLM